MKQQFVSPDDARSDTASQPDILAEIEERQRQHQKEAELRAARQAARDESRAEAEADVEALNAHIEGLLSANPEEFVIRFLQTEGQ